jgi:hypothetical protein
VSGERLGHARARDLDGSILTRDLQVDGERWAKGRRLTTSEVERLTHADDVQRPISLLVLEPGDLHEDEAALRLAAAVAGPGLVQRGPSESRVDLLAEWAGVLHVRVAALERLDRIDPLEVFTRFDGQIVAPGDLVASVKVAPHVVDERLIERAIRISGPRGLVRIAPWRRKSVAVLVKQALHAPARERFEASVRQKVEAMGSELGPTVYVSDAPEPVCEALATMATGPGRVDLVLTAGSASTDPNDPFYVAIEQLGGELIRHGVPAHPGSMLWLARVGRTDVIGLPTCGAYSKATAADLLLPRLLSGERADARTVARLGHGGVLAREMRFRMPPYARELEAEDG